MYFDHLITILYFMGFCTLVVAFMYAMFRMIDHLIDHFKNKDRSKPPATTGPRSRSLPAKHIFFEISALGLSHDAAVLAISAKVYENDLGSCLVEMEDDHLAIPIASFDANIEVDDAIDHGYRDESVVEWWRQQSDEDQYRAFYAMPRLPLRDALGELSAFFKEHSEENQKLFVWGDSPSFHCAVLIHAYHAVGLLPPWDRGQELDCSTVAYVAKRCGIELGFNISTPGINTINILGRLDELSN